MTAVVEAPRRSVPRSSPPSSREAVASRHARCLDRCVEFLPGLPYGSWEETDVDVGSVEWRVLTAEDERHLFRQMNLAYFHATELRAEIQEQGGDELAIAEFERLIRRAESIRDELSRAFSKLNYSIASRYTNRLNTFDELASEGQFTLLRAIARFNPERGFRFSTYAMHAIRRRIFRFLQQRQRQRQAAGVWTDPPLEMDQCQGSVVHERRVTSATAALNRLLLELSPRERYVIRSRFGWGREFEPRTLQDIAGELGVSRERIRQLEERALRKLRTLASTLDIEL